MVRLTVIISTIMGGPGARLGLPSRALYDLFELLFGDVSFSNHCVVGEHDGDAPVVEAEELIVGVDVCEGGIDAELAEEGKSLIAEVAALTGDQDDFHEAEPSAGA
jgi:hypothetical protein